MPDKEKDSKKPEKRSALAKAASAAKNDKKRRGANPDRKRGSLKEYFKGVKIETKKVVWPTRKELISYTVVVIFTCAFFALLIWGADSAFLAALSKLLGINY